MMEENVLVPSKNPDRKITCQLAFNYNIKKNLIKDTITFSVFNTHMA